MASRMTVPAALLAAFLAAPAAYPQADAPRPAAPAAQESGAPARPANAAKPGADPVQDKFRKLQKEMSQGGAPGAQERGIAAPGEEPGDAPAAAEQPSMISLSLQIVFGLVFVLVLAVVSIRLLKRFQGRLLSRPGGGPGGDLLEVLETCHLGTHQKVVALRINDEVGVVGVTQHGINLITVLKQPAGEIRKQRMASGNSAAFSDNLNKLLDRFKKPKRVSDLLEGQ